MIKVNTVLQEEALLQQVAEKKRTDEISLENFNLQKQIAKKEKNPNQLTEKIIESNEFFKNSLEKTYQRISELEQILRKNTENEEYLKKLLKKKEETTAHVETEGQENINKLQNENKLLLESYNTVKKHEKAQKERSDELEKEVIELKNSLETTKGERSCLHKGQLELAARNRNFERQIRDKETLISTQESKIQRLE